MPMRAVAVLVVLSLVQATAYADEQPWAVGVSSADKATAQARLDEGNQLFLAKEYRGALDKYLAAIDAWDHPAIRFNVVRCLMKLDRHVEAAEHLERALAYGAAPLEAGVYAEAKAVQEQLGRELAQLTVSCNIGDADVFLDGRPLFDCVGQVKRRVVAGRHQIVARKVGYVPFTHDFVAVGGAEAVVDVRLTTVDEGSVYRRRWSKWTPWGVVIGGGVIAAVGIPFQVLASGNMQDFRDRVAMCGPGGCAPGDPVNDIESRALLQNRVAISLWAVGGTITVAGLVMVYMNRERRVLVTPVVDSRSVGFALQGTL